ITEVKLSATTEEERDYLREDLSRTDAGKDELIRKAWDVRDAAVKRKTNTEIELARSRIDVMQINSHFWSPSDKNSGKWTWKSSWRSKWPKKMRAAEKKKLYNDNSNQRNASDASRDRKRSISSYPSLQMITSPFKKLGEPIATTLMISLKAQGTSFTI
ncbi:Uncharacterized protein FKW44_016552, partial [Caligus rogercresseyi]